MTFCCKARKEREREKEKKRERERERETDRQKDRQTETETDRQIGKESERQTDNRKTDRQTERQRFVYRYLPACCWNIDGYLIPAIPGGEAAHYSFIQFIIKKANLMRRDSIMWSYPYTNSLLYRLTSITYIRRVFNLYIVTLSNTKIEICSRQEN